MRRRTLIAAGPLAALAEASRAAPNDRRADGAARPHRLAHAKADALMQPLIGPHAYASIALAVVRRGEVVVERGYGLRALDGTEPPDASTVYWIQSLSKGLTAVGLLRLVGDGRLRLDEPASRHLRELPASWKPITVRQFLAHQSGIPQLDRKLPSFEQMLRAADTLPLDFEPGSRQDYNNFNFAVVGKLIEAVSGQAYLDFMRQRVFGPAGMTQTGLDLQSPNHALAYRSTPRGLKPIEREVPKADYGVPSGHLQSCVADLVKLHAALEGGALLDPGAYRPLVTRAVPRFDGTAGWFERRIPGGSIVSKNGGGQGSHTNVAFVPGQGHAVITLCALQGPLQGDRLIQRAIDGLFAEVCGLRLPGE